MRIAQHSFPSALARPAAALLAVAMLSGCQWFRSDNVFAEPEATRSLEVPPDLDLPNTAGAMPLPDAAPGAVTRSSMASAAPTTGFTVSGGRVAHVKHSAGNMFELFSEPRTVGICARTTGSATDGIPMAHAS